MQKSILRNLVLLFISFIVLNCTPSVERYKNKARKALQREDSQKALEYLQKAFEVSLDSEFFPVGKWHTYSNIYASVARNKIILIENQPSKTKAYFTVYEVAKDDDWRRRIKGYIRGINISPNGHYALIQLSDSQNRCTMDLWDLSSRDQITFSKEIPCGEGAGISDEGEVIFVGINKAIQKYNIKTGILDEKYISEIPAAPVKNVPGLGSFQYGTGNRLYFLYGSLGLYHFYIVENQKFRIISRDGAANKLYFIPGSENPGIITGGANNHEIVFFNPVSLDRVRTYPVRYWKDAVFLKNSDYFYVEDNRLVEVHSESETKLPFWAVRTFADAGGKVYFLSPRGQLICYKDNQPSQESKTIFQLGWEIK